MSENTAIRRVSFRSPAVGISAIPYLLNFTPEESIIIIWLNENRELIVTQRSDLPEFDTPEYMQWWVEATFHHEAGQQAYAASIIFVTSLEESTDALIDSVLTYVDEEKITSALITDFTAWREYGSRIVHPIRAEDNSAAAEALGTSPSRRPANRRSAIVAAFEMSDTITDTVISNACEEYDISLDSPSGTQTWFRRFGKLFAMFHYGETLSDRDLANVLVGFAVAPSRDAAIFALAEEPVSTKLIERLVKLTSRAPQSLRAQVATVTGIAAYLKGDGLRANIAVEVALEANEDYELAHLFRALIERGIDPAMLTEAITECDKL